MVADLPHVSREENGNWGCKIFFSRSFSSDSLFCILITLGGIQKTISRPRDGEKFNNTFLFYYKSIQGWAEYLAQGI